MTETITKENDYTLKIVQTDDSTSSWGGNVPVHIRNSYTRIFNFAAGQITTLPVTKIFQSLEGRAAGNSSISSQMHIQNFTDLPSTLELEILHKKLEDLGGHPPPLNDVLNGRSKRPLDKIPHKIG